jgi:hypothetical protein
LRDDATVKACENVFANKPADLAEASNAMQVMGADRFNIDSIVVDETGRAESTSCLPSESFSPASCIEGTELTVFQLKLSVCSTSLCNPLDQAAA